MLKYYKMYGDVPDMEFATAGSACLDVKAYFGTHEKIVKMYSPENVLIQCMAFQLTGEDVVHVMLPSRHRMLVPTGIILDIPERHSVRIHARSGLAIKHGISLSNSEGVIDEDYIEQVYVSLINNSDRMVQISHGDRIAQLEMVPRLAYTVGLTSKPSQKTSRSGGFGSTGV